MDPLSEALPGGFGRTPRYFSSDEGIHMQKRKLGRSGLEVSSLAFGGTVFGWTADEPTSLRLLDRFVDEGF
jgi:hypothetical protein